jgi:hypothetical protein
VLLFAVGREEAFLDAPLKAKFVVGRAGLATEQAVRVVYGDVGFVNGCAVGCDGEETRARTELGAAQKDTARELGAKLASLKGIVWVGVGLFVFGLASLVYPPLKVIVGSVTTSAALMFSGVALMVLPSMIVGNELLILGIVGIAVGGSFLVHRHGQLSGIVAASSGAQTPASNQSPVTSH